jgi:serine/threonine-protein kinase
MIQDPDQFFGRSRELNRVLSRLGAERPQSVSVVGERRIGKSSFLNALTWKEIQQRPLGSELTSIIVFLDFQRFHQVTLGDFFQLLEAQIRRSYPGLVDLTDLSGYEAFPRILESLREAQRSLLLLFDEFDSITSNPAFDLDFYSFMRSVANNYSVAYVTSSRIELQQICHSSEVADSPFFNIFSNLYLRPFRKDEALDLIRKPSAREGVPLEKFSENILELAGLFPFYLQIACSVYFECFQEDPEGEHSREDLKEFFLEEAGPHFQYFWEHLEPESKHVMRRILMGGQPGPEDRFICRKLERDGHLVSDGAKFHIFSPAFAEFIRILESSPSLGNGLVNLTSSGVTSSLSAGSQINQYRIVGRAGEGGMGVVYQAEDESLHRKVALKFCHPALCSHELVRRRLQREAVAAASLDHPAITSIHEMFEYSGQLALVLEWIEGRTLREFIVEDGPVDWNRLVPWLTEVCDGLQAAHEKGIIHRDIKSSNLMITEENRIKIMDFGLAKVRELEELTTTGLTGEGNLLGTLAYMSPEQAAGGTVDHRSDLFSLGVVFFECLTGKLPFQRDSAPATLHAIGYEPAPYLGLYRVQKADRLEPIVQRLLEKDPKARYSSAQELKKDLQNLSKRKKSLLSWLAPSADFDQW